jgi:hypothetical protein
MKEKKLKLKPSQRDKRRYFILNSKDKNKIEKAILDYLGILGFAKANYIKIEIKGQKKIMGSCLCKSLEDVRAALALSGISIEKVSGTIKGLLR